MGTFRTRDIRGLSVLLGKLTASEQVLHYNTSATSSSVAPVIGSVAAIALSLCEVQVTVTLSDTGGQPMETYTVSYMRH